MFTQEQKKILDKMSDISEVYSDFESISISINKSLEELQKVQSEIKIITSEKSKGFPWLADKIAEYFELRDKSIAEFLISKTRPALSTAEKLKEIAKEKRILRKEFIITKNLIDYYETLFPWLSDYVGEDLDELIRHIEEDENKSDEDEDPVFQYIPKAEYLKRPEGERNQLALDRYFSSRKHSWQIGRDYERYVGFLYEAEGYSVTYQGIERGMEDLGRDLICKKDGKTEIIQCKNWGQHKTIHEKHINQLFGTTIKYYLDFIANENEKTQMELFPDLLKKGSIKATFITTTKLSDTAKQFANALGIEIKESFLMNRYPVIKCNLAPNGNKIYHLPFDQQYDNTKIKKLGEHYVSTVVEAENLGFRRAWKWNKKTLEQ
jgi:hypothetical protein